MDAKVWIYIEPIVPVEQTQRVKYITDIASDPTYCKIEDLRNTLHSEYKFNRKITEEIKEKLLCGMTTVVNLSTKEVFKWEGDPVIVRQGPIRSNSNRNTGNLLVAESKKVQSIVNSRFFKK